MKNIVIVESPAKAKTINKYLGQDYQVIASYGHVRDLPSKNGSVDPGNDFEMVYELNPDAKKHIDLIAKASKDADRIYLASDPDREGEAIAWHVVEALKNKKISLKNKEIHRVSFTEITKKAVEQAFNNPRELDMDLVNAQQARRALDYLVGFNLSPILWRKLPGSRSAGRVQSVALRLICEREKEIEKFKSEEYWKINAEFKNTAGERFSSYLFAINDEKLEKFSITKGDQALEIVAQMDKLEYSVADIKKKKSTRNPYPPFITSTLQQEASRKIGFSAKKTMMIAQKLYEGVSIKGETVGLITYMRTDGVQLSEDAIGQIRNHIDKAYGKKYLPDFKREYKSKAKNAQEAHEAIRPTRIELTPDEIKNFLKDDELKLYSLIWKRAIASQMASVELNQTSVDINSTDGKFMLRATGSQVEFDGFYKVYKEGKDDKSDKSNDLADDDDENKMLPKLELAEKLAKIAINPSEHHTEPPARFTEATLVKKLEELGIGRPSTYASIISVLQDRNYVKYDKKKFFCEDRGRLVNSFLENFFMKYVEYNFTAELENKLDEVSSGKMDWKVLLTDFWKDFHEQTDLIGKKSAGEIIEMVNKDLAEHFFGNKDGAQKCPDCADGNISIKSGRFGIFVGCSNYPTCKYTKQIDEVKNTQEDTGDEAGNSFGKVTGTDIDIHIKKGPYGFYLETITDGDVKRSTIPSFVNKDEMTEDIANLLIALPKILGLYEDKEVKLGIGKFGPYILYEGKFHSIPPKIESLQMNLQDGIERITKDKNKEKVLGNHTSGKEIKLLQGKYGEYIKYDSKNFAIPKNMKDNITLEQAIEIINEKNN